MHARLAGLEAVLAGVLFMAWGALDMAEAPQYIVPLMSTLAFIVPALFLAALISFYARIRKRWIGWLGTIGFALSFLGAGLGVIRSVSDLTLWYTFVASKGPLVHLLLDWLFWLLAGLILIGIATTKTRALRHWGVLMLSMGSFGWAYYFTDTGGILEARLLHVLAGTLFSLSWVGLGYALHRGIR
jgi:hypothetical protein